MNGRFQIQGRFPHPDLVLVEDYVQRPVVATKTGESTTNNPSWLLRIHMDIELTPIQAGQFRNWLANRKNQEIYDAVALMPTDEVGARGLAVLEAVLGLNEGGEG